MRAITQIAPLADPVGQYGKFEVAVQLDADFSNPYDPTDIRLDSRFTGPYGASVTVPGFYYADFVQDLSGSRERLEATGDRSWRVRFTPDETGDWTYVLLAAAGADSVVESAPQTFTVTASGAHGFVRIDPRNPRYLAFNDGTPYFAIGEDMAWYSDDGMVDYQHWLDALAASGGNFIRVWMPAWGFGIEGADTGLGNYDARQDRAYQLDTLLEMVNERGVYIMLTLINHGQFSTSVDPEWDANPYNAANGGPLAEPGDFATNDEAQRLWQQRLRYIAARWGYSTNIMAWEWWNEINWTVLVNPTLLAPWIARSDAYLKTVDPYHHLTTHSGSPVGDETVWSQMDVVQQHLYNMTNAQTDISRATTTWLEEHPGQPFLVGEFGSPSEYDINGVLLHLGLWDPPMNGASGTGMTWWWDSYIPSRDLYYQFAGVAAFFAGEDLAAHTYEPTTATLNREARSRVFGLQDGHGTLLWVVSKQYSENELLKQYAKNLREGVENPLDITFPENSEAVLTLNGLADGDYAVEWWDTFSGEIAQTATVTVSDGTADISVPAFSTDWAVKVKPA